ncbi:hypothetical protein C0J52_17832, partial [Blattella germanica]
NTAVCVSAEENKDDTAQSATSRLQQLLRSSSSVEKQEIEMKHEEKKENSESMTKEEREERRRERGFKRRVKTQLSIDERRFLLAVQKGDIKTTRRYDTSLYG